MKLTGGAIATSIMLFGALEIESYINPHQNVMKYSLSGRVDACRYSLIPGVFCRSKAKRDSSSSVTYAKTDTSVLRSSEVEEYNVDDPSLSDEERNELLERAFLAQMAEILADESRGTDFDDSSAWDENSGKDGYIIRSSDGEETHSVRGIIPNRARAVVETPTTMFDGAAIEFVYKKRLAFGNIVMDSNHLNEKSLRVRIAGTTTEVSIDPGQIVCVWPHDDEENYDGKASSSSRSSSLPRSSTHWAETAAGALELLGKLPSRKSDLHEFWSRVVSLRGNSGILSVDSIDLCVYLFQERRLRAWLDPYSSAQAAAVQTPTAKQLYAAGLLLFYDEVHFKRTVSRVAAPKEVEIVYQEAMQDLPSSSSCGEEEGEGEGEGVGERGEGEGEGRVVDAAQRYIIEGGYRTLDEGSVMFKEGSAFEAYFASLTGSDATALGKPSDATALGKPIPSQPTSKKAKAGANGAFRSASLTRLLRGLELYAISPARAKAPVAVKHVLKRLGQPAKPVGAAAVVAALREAERINAIKATTATTATTASEPKHDRLEDAASSPNINGKRLTEPPRPKIVGFDKSYYEGETEPMTQPVAESVLDREPAGFSEFDPETLSQSLRPQAVQNAPPAAGYQPLTGRPPASPGALGSTLTAWAADDLHQAQQLLSASSAWRAGAQKEGAGPVGKRLANGRMDWRGARAEHPFISLDSKRTSFFDDCFSLSPATGELMVHVTDVVGVLRRFPQLEALARSRVSSVFTPSGPAHMLPPAALEALRLSPTGPNQVMTVALSLDADSGELLGFRVFPSIIGPVFPVDVKIADELCTGATETDMQQHRAGFPDTVLRDLLIAHQLIEKAIAKQPWLDAHAASAQRRSFTLDRRTGSYSQSSVDGGSPSARLVNSLLTAYSNASCLFCGAEGTTRTPVAVPVAWEHRDRTDSARVRRFATQPLRSWLSLMQQRQLRAAVGMELPLSSRECGLAVNHHKKNRRESSSLEGLSRQLMSFESLESHCAALSRAGQTPELEAQGLGHGGLVRIAQFRVDGVIGRHVAKGEAVTVRVLRVDVANRTLQLELVDSN